MGVPFHINILSLQMLICFFVVLCVFYSHSSFKLTVDDFSFKKT